MPLLTVLLVEMVLQPITSTGLKSSKAKWFPQCAQHFFTTIFCQRKADFQDVAYRSTFQLHYFFFHSPWYFTSTRSQNPGLFYSGNPWIVIMLLVLPFVCRDNEQGILWCWFGHSSQSHYPFISTADIVFGPNIKCVVTLETDLQQSRKSNFPVSFSSSSFGRKGLFPAPGSKTFFFIKRTGHAVSVGPECMQG